MTTVECDCPGKKPADPNTCNLLATGAVTHCHGCVMKTEIRQVTNGIATSPVGPMRLSTWLLIFGLTYALGKRHFASGLLPLVHKERSYGPWCPS